MSGQNQIAEIVCFTRKYHLPASPIFNLVFRTWPPSCRLFIYDEDLEFIYFTLKQFDVIFAPTPKHSLSNLDMIFGESGLSVFT